MRPNFDKVSKQQENQFLFWLRLVAVGAPKAPVPTQPPPSYLGLGVGEK